MKGYIHVYTGNGKGKTTAAIGLAVRAIGAGKKVFFAQFVKGMVYSEIDAIQRFLPGIEVKQYGRECFIYRQADQKDVEAAQSGLHHVAQIIASQQYDVIILDEANIAVHFNLISVEQLMEVLKAKPEETEIVVTGRYAPNALIEMADLVTEMKEVKHYYKEGVVARVGIER
jgi:cob(I)alamin adenosyltransferase